MKQLLLTAILCCMALAAGAQKVSSPNRKLSIKTDGDKLVICHNKKQVLAMTEAPQGKLKFVGKVKDDYRMLTGKRLHCLNEANEYEASIGQDARMVMRLYNDGIAFRYEYSGLQDSKVPEEHTAYIIPEGTKRWMQQWSDSYEGFFPLTTTAKVKALEGFGGATEQNDINTHWGYPLLVEASPGVLARRSGGTWYVAGINGKDEPQTLATNLRFIGKGSIQMFADDAEGNWLISNPQKLPSEVSCQPRGGFVLVVSPNP